MEIYKTGRLHFAANFVNCIKI